MKTSPGLHVALGLPILDKNVTEIYTIARDRRQIDVCHGSNRKNSVSPPSLSRTEQFTGLDGTFIRFSASRRRFHKYDTVVADH